MKLNVYIDGLLKMKCYKLTEHAERDLTGIWVYIAEDNVTAADALNKIFFKYFQLLADNPGLARERPELLTCISHKGRYKHS